ncbi:MAG TPA: SDR family oxidoreductase [Opitutaceae bacterium]
MRILVTGHDGYIGHVLVPLLQGQGHEVVGLDSGYFRHCTFGAEPASPPALWKDLREVVLDDLRGFDAVCHLAALSNDPLGNLAPQTTYSINYDATVRLARLAKEAGVKRFVFSSSCSNYGAAGDAMLDESASFNPVTPYAVSKVRVEHDVAPLADANFSPIFLRSATAYGASPKLRGDLLVNNLVGHAFTTGEILIQSDGTPWRPFVHIEDISRAFAAVLEAPREVVHNEAFNVGRTEENYQVRDIAEMVREALPGARIVYAPGGSPDARNYRVRFDKIASRLPGFRPQWTLRAGIEELHAAYRAHGLTREEFLGSRYQRLRTVKELQNAGRLDENLRWLARAA